MDQQQNSGLTDDTLMPVAATTEESVTNIHDVAPRTALVAEGSFSLFAKVAATVQRMERCQGTGPVHAVPCRVRVHHRGESYFGHTLGPVMHPIEGSRALGPTGPWAHGSSTKLRGPGSHDKTQGSRPCFWVPRQTQGARVPPPNPGVSARVPGPTTTLRGPGLGHPPCPAGAGFIAPVDGFIAPMGHGWYARKS